MFYYFVTLYELICICKWCFFETKSKHKKLVQKYLEVIPTNSVLKFAIFCISESRIRWDFCRRINVQVYLQMGTQKYVDWLFSVDWVA